MNKYRICDINKLLDYEDIIVNADSPKDALTKAGYSNIKRDYSGKYGNIVVYVSRASYVYSANHQEV